MSRRWMLRLRAVMFVTTCALAAVFAPERGQAADPAGSPAPIDVTGFVDAYYAYKLNQTGDLYRNFDGTHNSFSLNLVEVAFERKPSAASRIGFRADLDYGPAADAFGSLDTDRGSSLSLEQAYVSLLAGKVQFDAGKFVTQHGAEVIETKDNWNYSRSLLFALAIPYYHYGIRAAYSPSEKVSLAGFVVNGWNNAIDNNTGKTFGAMLALKPSSKLTLVQNFMVGPEQTDTNDDARLLSDTVLTVAPGGKLTLMANFDYGKQGDAQWLGVAGYLRFQASEKIALIPRVEWLDDSDGFMTGTSQKLKEVTLTLEDKIAGGLLARVEFRRDFSDVAVFTDSDGGDSKGQSGVTVGLVYAFGGKLLD